MIGRIQCMATVILIVLAAAVMPGFSAEKYPSWSQAEKDLTAAWPTAYPGEKVLTIEKNGEPSAYDKLKAAGSTKIDEHGDKWEYYTKNTFCQVPAKATVQQSSGKRIFNVSAIYRKTDTGWVFDEIGVGNSAAVAEQGQDAPSKDEVKKLIADLWVKLNPGVKVSKVAISAPELKKDSETGRWWYNTGADIYSVDESGSERRFSNDYTVIYKGEKEKEGVNPSGPWKVYFLDDPQ